MKRFSTSLFGVSTLIVASLFAAATVTALPTFTICYIAREGKTEPALTAMFAVDYYRALYPSNDWRFKFVVNLDPSVNALTTRQVLLGWLQNGTGCDALIGPGHSEYNVAVGPVVTIPWLDYSAQSTQLSDKGQFPTFGRTIPTTDIGPRQTAILVYELFGWKYANVICVNDPYGTAAAASFTNALYSFGGGALTNCLGTTATLADVNALLDLIEATRYSRVIYIASSINYVTFANLIAAMLARDTGKRFAIIFAEAACSGPSAWSTVPGALCSGYTLNQTTVAPFTAAYMARNTAPGVAALKVQGFPASTIKPLSVTSSAAFSVDAVQFMMGAQFWYTTLNVSSVPLYTFMHNVTVEGLTGLVEQDKNGDRPIAAGVLYNIVPSTNGTTVQAQIGAIDGSGATQFTSATSFLLDGTFTNGVSHIQDTYPVSTGSSQQTTTIVLAVVLPLAAILAAGVLLATRSSGGRNVSNAPKSGQITLIFTDIQSSTKLWSTCPASMSVAIELHHDLIRKVITRHGGYEVKTVGDSFMIACKTAAMGAQIAHDIQLELQQTKFPAAIAEVYATTEEDFIDVDDNPDRLAPLHPVWNGVRVRIGCHTGEPSVVFDEVTRGYDYYGPPVNQAARVESVARGGEICASREFLDASGEVGTLMGHVILKGIPDPVPIFDVASSGIPGRHFEPFDHDSKSVQHDAKLGNEPSFSDTESMASAAFSSIVNGDGTDSLEARVSKLPVVSKNWVTLRTAVDQVKLIASAFAEQFKVMKPKEREQMEAKLLASWHIKLKGKSGPTQAYEELALRTYTRAHRGAALAAATTTDEMSSSARPNLLTTDDGGIDNMRMQSPTTPSLRRQ